MGGLEARKGVCNCRHSIIWLFNSFDLLPNAF